MKKNLSVLICDDDRFYASGLQTLISTWASERKLNVNFADQFQLRARSEIIFISQSELSSYRLHALRMEITAFRRYVFVIQQQESSNRDDLNSLKENFAMIPRQAQPAVIQRYLETALRKLESFAASSPQTAGAISVSSPLTFRETQILRFLARGISHATVARYLQISEKTVSTHKRNIMTKLNISRTTELNYWLIDEGFFRSPPSFNALANNRHSTNT
ncbi:DNA-binding response regulator, NarL/FixJ family, contains REC and HTH domains [Izhakiella capsodis]|uniref:DNA-binding response regulator, NarL/FixJ family, contains REC and HTH domains n=1 Tax=Izhakiella capsodis TaxID=1367852 RepID=A0A1I5AT41_9GAMM|nr:LuxR C-terminal-related transcriptional regulator [Izhakiella capsodis]SFN65617.1 DNA-binding response regulator, NarL/FixJ family, contains REC and HTH domains [Izhakiella capsodis]